MEKEYSENGYDIKIEIDDDPINPRKDYKFGNMICSHKRYDLGDIQTSRSDFNDFPDSWDEYILYFINHKYDLRSTNDDGELSNSSLKMIENWIKNNLVIKDLYLYDHSGITMNTTGFSCNWDSGKVGFIYADKDEIRKEYDIKRITKNVIKEVEERLISEVAVYDQYISDTAYRYTIEKDGEHIDSCSGYYDTDQMESEIKNIISDKDIVLERN